MALSMRQIVKSFDANRVLKGVDFSVGNGEIRALIGENGAGKSTLMNILGGVLQADSGTIEIDGQERKFLVPRDSIDAGIAFIHQELNLINDLNIFENLFIGRELRKKNGFLDKAEMARQTKEVLSRLEIDIDPRTMLSELDASYKQIVEIARALLMKATIIIMDEPTTSLTDVEIARVFKMMRTLRDQGVSLVFISHKLKEILEVCDSYTVLRDGEVVMQGKVEGVTELDLARHMVGHDVRTEKLSRRMNIGGEALRVEKLSREREFENISFTLRSGEILGFTGLLGDGRSELFTSVFGAAPEYSGEIFVGGKKMHMRSTTAAYKAGLGYVPRNRKENGIIRDMSILHNGSIVTYEEIRHGLLIDHKRELANMTRNREDLSIKMGEMDDPITSLSGGNQQKVVLAKWLSAAPKVLIFDNPTQGVDVGAKEEIYDIILRLAEEGVGIVILSSEAQEIIRLCDRTVVMYHGREQGVLEAAEMTESNIMVLATGGDKSMLGAGKGADKK
ncbi:MAG: sugar ABC transporter ATP-binding protein [Eubacteriales bacterium]|nr:sugar ABC transporter ATP-binding protein [Eubacteriales bacterium]